MSADAFAASAPSLASTLQRVLRIHEHAPLLGARSAESGGFVWHTAGDVRAKAAALSAGFRVPPLSLRRRAHVAICLPNRPEWIITDFASAFGDFVVVGLHQDWSTEKIEAIFQDADVECVVTSAAIIRKFASCVEHAPLLKSAVLLDRDELGDFTCPAKFPECYSYSDIVENGRRVQCTYTGFGFGVDCSAHRDSEDDPEAVFTLMYSSGTSGGPPKAVATPKSVWIQTNCKPGPLASIAARGSRCSVSYMALAHGADRGIVWLTTMAGGRCGFVSASEGSEDFFNDLRELKPTLMLGLSYFWQDLHSRHVMRLDPVMFDYLRRRLGREKATAARSSPEWPLLRKAICQTREGFLLERSLLRQARDELGSSLLIALTGGSPTPAPVLEFMQGCLTDGNETRVYDSYGSTEFPGISCNGEIDDSVDLELREVRRGDQVLYSPASFPPRGEIFVRRKKGARTFYWKREHLNTESWSGDWYMTGDIGELQYSPSMATIPASVKLRIIDRKTSLEEIYWQHDSVWIATQRLESDVYGAIVDKVLQVVLLADRNREGLIAVVVPTKAAVESWEKDQIPAIPVGETAQRQSKFPRGSPEAHQCIPPDFEKDMLETLIAAGRQAGLRPFEIPMSVIIDLIAWTCDERIGDDVGLLTLTGKPKRGLVKRVYTAALSAKYTQQPAATASSSQHAIPLATATHNEQRNEFGTSVLLQVLRCEAADEVHSQAQHATYSQLGLSLPEVRRGSRVCDLRFTDEQGQQKEVQTARGRDWIAGPQAFEFCKVRDIDSTGSFVKAGASAKQPSGPVDLSISIVQGTSQPVSCSCHSLEVLKVLRRRVGAKLALPPFALRLFLPDGSELRDEVQALENIGIANGILLKVTAETCDEAFYKLSPPDMAKLNAALAEVRKPAFELRNSAKQWSEQFKEDRTCAEERLQQEIDTMDAGVKSAVRTYSTVWGNEMAAASGKNLEKWLASTSPEGPRLLARQTSFYGSPQTPLLNALSGVLSAVLQGHLSILQRQDVLGRVEEPPAHVDVLNRLNAAVVQLRTVGDATDVDTRILPVTWTLDIDWACPPTTRPWSPCIMPGCGLRIFNDQIFEHTQNFTTCIPSVGVVPDDYDDGKQGTTMGGNQSIICDVTGTVIDAEATELLAAEGKELPHRTPRYHSIDSGIDRRPEYHELFAFLHTSVAQAASIGLPGADAAMTLLREVDSKTVEELWVHDKQHLFWLTKHVRAGRDLGRKNTPASLINRACDAFAARPCLAMPSTAILPSDTLPRMTSRSILPESIKSVLMERDGYLWLKYADLKSLIDRAALLLLGLLPQNAFVAISGYNDFEWVVADFAIASAGMVSVGVHTTYDENTAIAVMQKSGCIAICAMLDLFDADRRTPRWAVTTACSKCPDITTVIAMDANREQLPQAFVASFQGQVASFLNPDVSCTVQLPDPFDAQGAAFDTDDPRRIHSLLFTSGSTGSPKAVAVGIDAFVNDTAGDSNEAAAFSSSVTVSYIPLSHSSDRYKVWQHVICGGRVGFCFFDASNWEAHEKEKKDAMIEYTSPAGQLFAQVRKLRPTSMACPPNIWAWLYSKYQEHLADHSGTQTTEVLQQACRAIGTQYFGDRIKALATGGAPTPIHHLEFAQNLSRSMGASFVNSYGTTEAGALASNGRRIGSKFVDSSVVLVNCTECGFTVHDKPCPRGEVVVASLSLALGYYRQPEATRKAFVDVDESAGYPCPSHITPPLRKGRWYFTGDLASIDETGYITLIDRVHAAVSLRDGRVVRCGKVESALEELPGVHRALVHAGPVSNSVGAILLMGADGVDSMDSLTSPIDSVLEAQLRADPAWLGVTEALENGDIKMCQAVGQWTEANGLISGELKKRRGALLKYYEMAFSNMLKD